MAAASKKVVQQNSPATDKKVVFPTTEEMIKQGLTTKSARIRLLHSMGMGIGAIAKQETGGLYQHAYNVIKKPLKRVEPAAATPAEEKTEEPTKQEA